MRRTGAGRSLVNIDLLFTPELRNIEIIKDGLLPQKILALFVYEDLSTSLNTRVLSANVEAKNLSINN